MTPLRFAITSPHQDVKRTYTSKLSFMRGVRIGYPSFRCGLISFTPRAGVGAQRISMRPHASGQNARNEMWFGTEETAGQFFGPVFHPFAISSAFGLATPQI